MSGSELGRPCAGAPRVLAANRNRNALVADIASEFNNVEILAPRSFMTPDEIAAQETPHHYDRIVYFRMFQHVMARVG